jgi:hypothetical protein
MRQASNLSQWRKPGGYVDVWKAKHMRQEANISQWCQLDLWQEIEPKSVILDLWQEINYPNHHQCRYTGSVWM